VGIARSPLNDLQSEVDTPRFIPIVGDIVQSSTCKEAVDAAIDTWGRLDGVVHNAAILEPIGRLADATLTSWQKHFDVNLYAIVQLTQLSIPHLRTSEGRIIMISSGAATGPMVGWSAYNCSKAAMNMLTQCLNVEEPLITTIALRPGVVDTDMQKQIREQGERAMDPSMHAYFLELKANDKLVAPDYVAHIIAEMVDKAERDLAGSFISYDNVRLKQYWPH
jgi:NAD(P)-dependent dehydrogenase (short-subunit alcohol dehydrogenase family)